jgi:hypothetical protein
VALTTTDPRPEGLNTPTAEELAAPSKIAPADSDSVAINRFQEIYTDCDVREQQDSSGIFLFSYGEYTDSCDTIDYRPYVERAERMAKLHLQYLTASDESLLKDNIVRIARREWFCATKPDIAVVHVYLEVVHIQGFKRTPMCNEN